MTLEEFWKQGYLQELNRQFLHPLGLALSITLKEDGSLEWGDIIDSRSDPEGMCFDWDITQEPPQPRLDRYSFILEEQARRSIMRVEKLGYVVQPITRKNGMRSYD